jgi:hypothetical protein
MTSGFSPERVAHDETALLAPIVPKIHRVDVIFQCFSHLRDVVVRYRPEKGSHKIRIIIEVHEQGAHASKSPGTLEERKAEAEQTKAIAAALQLRGDFAKDAVIQRIGKRITVEAGLG